jgi:hemerythrin-like domain-containing protein
MKIHLCLAGLVLSAAPIVFAADGLRPTESFRQEHAGLKVHLEHLDEMLGSMQPAEATQQKKTAAFVVKFLREHIVDHAEWEEKRLYPAVDRRTHAGDHPFTESMRYEHTIIGRWIEELGTMAADPTFDAKGFARKADRLLGLIAAHFEEEEEVLLPILDRTTTREELERELGLETVSGKHEH